jgi:hypothetical protein
VTAHDFGHLDAVRRRTTGGGVDDLCVLIAMVVEPMNGAAWNAQGLPGPDLDWCAINGLRQNCLDTVDGFFVTIVAVCRPCEPLRSGEL